MRRELLLTIMCFLSLVAMAQKKEAQQVAIQTSAICEMCKEKIEYELTFAKGIKFVELDLDSKIVTVEFNQKKTSAHDIRKRITQIGYHADSLRRDPEGYEKLPFCCKDGGHDH
ncbi:MAG: cation transporter [Cyclobacteriaceae bacterium]|nr:cation transporter [Cyclobacteriaceae bacterium HetDA_MAG_MS6]